MDAAGERLVRVAKALGDPTRLELLRRVARAGESCCKDLVALFPISQATVSHHLKILVDAGLLSVRRDGPFGWYSLRPATLEAHADLLGRTLGGRRRPRAAGTSRPTRVSLPARRAARHGNPIPPTKKEEKHR